MSQQFAHSLKGLTRNDVEVRKPRQRPPLPFLPSPDGGEQGKTVKVKISDDLEER